MTDQFRTEYAPLFSIALRHDALLSRGGETFERLDAQHQRTLLAGFDSRRLLQLRPDSESALLMQRHALRLRSTADGVMVAASVRRPAALALIARPLPAGSRLRLLMTLRDPALLTYSNLPLASGRDFYRFSTAAANVDRYGAHLSRPLAAFDAGRRYRLGDVLVDDPAAVDGPAQRLVALVDTGPGPRQPADWAVSAALPAADPGPFNPGQTRQGDRIRRNGFVFEALVNGPANDVDDPVAWRRLFPISWQAVSVADRVDLRASRYRIEVAVAAERRIHIELRDAQDQPLDRWQVSAPDAIPQLDIDLRGRPVGQYRLLLSNDQGRLLHPPLTPNAPLAVADESVYIDDEAASSGAFGVIDIGIDDPGYALFNADGSLAEPTWLLRFMSRLTTWRYHFPADLSGEQIATIPASLVQDGNRRLRTAAAHPLGSDFVPLGRFDSGQLLPNPSPRQGLRLVEGRLISDLFLNH